MVDGSTVLYVRVPRPVAAAVRALAAEHQTSLATVCTRALSFYLVERCGIDLPEIKGLP